MKNRSLEVFLNNEHLATGAIESGLGPISTLVSWRKLETESDEDIHLQLVGMDSENKKSLRWLNQDLKIGDIITLVIAEDGIASPIIGNLSTSKELDIEKKIKAYHY